MRDRCGARSSPKLAALPSRRRGRLTIVETGGAPSAEICWISSAGADEAIRLRMLARLFTRTGRTLRFIHGERLIRKRPERTIQRIDREDAQIQAILAAAFHWARSCCHSARQCPGLRSIAHNRACAERKGTLRFSPSSRARDDAHLPEAAGTTPTLYSVSQAKSPLISSVRPCRRKSQVRDGRSESQ